MFLITPLYFNYGFERRACFYDGVFLNCGIPTVISHSYNYGALSLKRCLGRPTGGALGPYPPSAAAAWQRYF